MFNLDKPLVYHYTSIMTTAKSSVMNRVAGHSRALRMKTYLENNVKVKGDPPINPFKSLREEGVIYGGLYGEDQFINMEGRTLKEITEATGLAKQSLIRTEQGVFTEVPDRLLTYYTQRHQLSYPVLRNAYEDFQKEYRRWNERLFGDFPTLIQFENAKHLHPLHFLRMLWSDPLDGSEIGELNVTEVSKLLCLPQSLLQNFEKKVANQASVPTAFLAALLDNGYNHDHLTVFIKSYRAYRNDYLVNMKAPLPVGNNSLLKEGS